MERNRSFDTHIFRVESLGLANKLMWKEGEEESKDVFQVFYLYMEVKCGDYSEKGERWRDRIWGAIGSSWEPD